MEIGSQINVTISAIAFGGDGVARTNEGVVFVPETAVGDQGMVTITSVHKTFARGEMVALDSAGPGHAQPQCPHYGKCGGCQYQHLDYETEFQAKCKQLTELLSRIGGIGELPPLEVAMPSPEPYGYRNKMRLEAALVDGQLRYGYYLKDNRTFQPIKHCPLVREELNQLLPKALRSDWAKENARRATRPRREAPAAGGKFRRNGKDASRTPAGPGALTLRLSTRGEEVFYFGFAPSRITWLHEKLADFEYSVPAGAFWQINPPVASELIRTVTGWLQNRSLESLIDAYGGVGTFSCAAGDFVERLIIESDRGTTAAAQLNLQNCQAAAQIIADTTEKALPKALPKYKADSCAVLLDPPRTGCQPVVIDTLLKCQPAVIAYVSCNPSTLARDLKLLLANCTYKLEKLALFDMFPRTAHFESAVLLTRIN